MLIIYTSYLPAKICISGKIVDDILMKRSTLYFESDAMMRKK
jgi:hypothetical protein